MVTMFPLLLQLCIKKTLSMATCILALVMYMYTVKIAPKKASSVSIDK